MQTARPWGVTGPTPEQVWSQREPITAELRQRFLKAVPYWTQEERNIRGYLPGIALASNVEASINRVGIGPCGCGTAAACRVPAVRSPEGTNCSTIIVLKTRRHSGGGTEVKTVMLILKTASETACYLETFFGSASASLTELPHCIVESNEEVLRAVLSVTGAQRVGVWGDRPLSMEDGSPYLPPEDGMIVEDFVLWELPQNQRFATEIAAFGRVDGFVMTIDTRTPAKFLRRTYEIAKGDQTFEYNKFIAAVPHWMNELGWAFIPLDKTYSSEIADALLITSRVHRGWVVELKERLIAKKQQCIQVEHTLEGYVFVRSVATPPSSPDARSCRSAPARRAGGKR